MTGRGRQRRRSAGLPAFTSLILSRPPCVPEGTQLCIAPDRGPQQQWYQGQWSTGWLGHGIFLTMIIDGAVAPALLEIVPVPDWRFKQPTKVFDPVAAAVYIAMIRIGKAALVGLGDPA